MVRKRRNLYVGWEERIAMRVGVLMWVGRGRSRRSLASGHIGTPCEQTDMIENITFLQTTYMWKVMEKA